MAGFNLQPSATIEGVIVCLILLLVTFLVGSIPWGVVISRLFYKRDIRNEGSGNIGTTNAMRSLGRVGGVAVFILDFAKGLGSGGIGVLVASLITQGSPEATLQAFARIINPFVAEGSSAFLQVETAQAVTNFCVGVSFLGCVWGHIFSPWLRFKGGKGIAVAIGCLFVLFGPIGAIIELASFAIVVLITRYVSAGSLTASVLCPVICLCMFWGEWMTVIVGTVAALTVIWAHRGNISRLRHGTERRVGDKRSKDSVDANKNPDDAEVVHTDE